jgi:hypothetical protein
VGRAETPAPMPNYFAGFLFRRSCLDPSAERDLNNIL